MKKIYKINIWLFIIAISLLGLACETEDHFYTGPGVYMFLGNSNNNNIAVKEAGENIYQIQIGATTVSIEDRIANMIIKNTSTAILGTHFVDVPLQITIPAGEVVSGMFSITGIYAGFADDTAKTVVLGFEEGTGMADTEFTLSMQRTCPYDLSDFEGTYDVVDKRFHRNGNDVREFTYEATVEVVAGSSDQLKILNLGGYGGEVIIDVELLQENILPFTFEAQTSGYDSEIFNESGLPFGDVTYREFGEELCKIEVCDEKIYISYATFGSPGFYAYSDEPAVFTKK